MRIGIDLGGTKIVGGLVDENGRVTARSKIPTRTDSGYPGVLKSMVRLIEDIREQGGVSKEAVERIGIAAAGQIEKRSHSIVFSPNLGFRNVPIRDDVERESGISTFVENDVNAATYGEWKFGLKEIPSHALGIFVGTGIGGGLILDGKLYKGFSNVGGEIGHMIVNPHGYPCHCGNTGCFEAYCGGSYIVERVKRRLRGGYRGRIWPMIGGNVEVLNTGHIEEAFFEGDELCRAVWEEVIEYMGVGLASLVNVLNPEMVILGGGVVFGSKSLIDEAIAAMEKRVMPASMAGLQFERARLGEDAAIAGAAYVE
jgi:glucokinase